MVRAQVLTTNEVLTTYNNLQLTCYLCNSSELKVQKCNIIMLKWLNYRTDLHEFINSFI